MTLDEFVALPESQRMLRHFSRGQWRELFHGSERLIAQAMLVSLWEQGTAWPRDERLKLLKAAHAVLPLRGECLQHLTFGICQLREDGTPLGDGLIQVPLDWLDVPLLWLENESRKSSLTTSGVSDVIHTSFQFLGEQVLSPGANLQRKVLESQWHQLQQKIYDLPVTRS